ncbi:hypothetical protein [Kaistia sp. MMO-174]|uniref:hypothetical protein n=1 Tax=Kaistia sp. MMO-174 TaxID=3081256 RepID=UPI00301726D1
MAVFWIVTTLPGKLPDRPYQLVFSAPEYETVKDLSDALAARGTVPGERLSVIDDGKGRKMVRARSPYAIGAFAIGSIQPSIHEIWEPED